MKFKATFSSVGVQWLERFAPIFDKLGKELSVLFTPNSIHLVQNHAESGGIEIHADLLKDEVFDACLLQSANDNKIGVRLEPASLCRVLRGLVGSEATHVEVKLIKREVAPGTSLPFLCFDSKGVVDVVQDVPLAGPLNRREVEDLETIVQANVVDVPYWLCLDRAATEAAHAAVERFRAVGDVVELATTKAGSLHLTTNKGGHVALGAELRGAGVLPASEDRYESSRAGGGGAWDGGTGRGTGTQPGLEDESAGPCERLAESKACGEASVANVGTRTLRRSLSGVASNPSRALVGVAGHGRHVELVFRYDRQAVRGPDAVGLMVRMPVEEDDELERWEEDSD